MGLFLYLRKLGIFVLMNSNSLLKGTLTTLVLKLLKDNGQMYGYEIIQKIKLGTEGEIKITEGALYPALHKLEEEGLLQTELRKISGRVRKYYTLSEKGVKATESKLIQLNGFINSIQSLIQNKTS